MRLLYFILKYTVLYATHIFFPRQKLIKGHNFFFGRTIYVSNHASSFMDPIMIGSSVRPILFFMTRSDIFNSFTWPILWLLQMLPIFREHDGHDMRKKNEEVIKRCRRVLVSGRNLLIFGEGFTDDIFIRRLKPVKKGAARIGFATLESIKWKKKIYIAAIGCNYSDPSMMRTDFLLSMSERICLNDYKDEYILQPNKVISDVTKKIQQMMRDQITHVQDKNLASFHENIMKITRKGMNAQCFDNSIKLKDRWLYSKQLAIWINEHVSDDKQELTHLKESLEKYFLELKKANIDEHLLYEYKTKGRKKTKDILFLLITFPFALLGVIHCGLFYFLCKQFTEKTFKRRVFWSSVKMMSGMIFIGLANTQVIFLFYNYIYPSYFLAILYYLSIGWLGLCAYLWFKKLQTLKLKRKISQQNIDSYWNKRTILEKEIERLILGY